MKLRGHALRLAGLILSVSCCARAQTPGPGGMSGTVTDPVGRVSVHVNVVVTDEATHVARSKETNDSGIFRLPLLPPGNYTVEVFVPGFAPSVIHNVRVQVSEMQAVDI